MKKPQTGYVTFCEINIVTLPTGKLWRVFVFPSSWGSCREWRNIKNVGGNCIYCVIYWSFAVASKLNSFIGRKQKGLGFFCHWWAIKVISFPSVFGYRSGSTVIAGINLFPCICAHAMQWAISYKDVIPSSTSTFRYLRILAVDLFNFHKALKSNSFTFIPAERDLILQYSH